MKPEDLKELAKAVNICMDTGEITWLSPKKHSNQKCGDRAGFTDNYGYRMIKFGGKCYLAHRVIFFFANGYLPEEVDHRNGNRLDNRISNLRAATKSNNMQNSKMRKTNTSGVKGVYWCKAKKKWIASIRSSGVRHNLGSFIDFFEACCAIHSARNKYHGEFANHG